MDLLIGGDSELGAATYRYLQKRGQPVQATTRRPETVSAERPFFDLQTSSDSWQLGKDADAACIFAAVARVLDCATDPLGSAAINVTQTLRLIDKLNADGTYVLYLSSNQVFDGNNANVPVEAPTCPVSEYGHQKATAEAAIRERIARGAPIGILRLSKVLSPNLKLIQQWTDALLSGKSIRAFNDMAVAPVPIDMASAAIARLLKDRTPGVYQLSGPRDVAYFEIARHLARALGASTDLIESVSASSAGMPKGSTPRHTTLDSSFLRQHFGIAVPDVWDALSPLLEAAKTEHARQKASELKVIALDDLTEVAGGVYYSHYPLPLVDADMVEFLKGAARKSPLRRARFCAHLSPQSEQHDMLIASHRDTYVTPHRHLSKSETMVVLEGTAEIILFDDNGAVVKTVKMGPPASGRPFFYRMPPRQFHSLAIESELLVFLENTKGPFTLDDREYASWAPEFNDTENGKAYIASLLRRANEAPEPSSAN